MGKYFGTDGFRGEAGITLTADHAYKVGRFLGWYYNALRERNGDTDPARIVIGKDTRRSSYMFEYSLVAGLTASGADAYLLHVTTTPSVAYIARVDDFDCGIMISASHNPYYDNGIKLIDCYGEKCRRRLCCWWRITSMASSMCSIRTGQNCLVLIVSISAVLWITSLAVTVTWAT